MRYKLAEFLKVKAIAPGEETTPGFVGDIVNNLDTLWAKPIRLHTGEDDHRVRPAD